MKKILIIILTISLVLSGCDTNIIGKAQVSLDEENVDVNITADEDVDQYSDDYLCFFDDSFVHELNITIEASALEDMFENGIEEAFHQANISLDGYTLDNIAIRTKGNSTLRDVANSDSIRYSFKIKTNEYEDQKLLGLDEFVINNMYSDASYMREYFSYDLFDTVGLDASETSFVNVYFNGELQGLYLLVETVDDSFLNRNFGDNDGNLYRMDQGSSLTVVNGQYSEAANQKNGDDESKSDLYNFMDILNAMMDGQKGDIESVLDVESALMYIAANTLLESYDSYNGQFAQNFYLYNNEGIFTVIPWDYNMAFGTFSSNLLEISVDQPVSGTSLEERPLINNLLAVDEYRERYYEILDEMISYFDSFEEDVAGIRAMISEEVEADPTKFSTYEDFLSSTIYQEDGDVEVNLMGENMGGRGERPEGQTPPDRQDPPTNDQMPTDQQGMPPGDRPDMNQQTHPGMDEGQTGMSSGNGISIINIIQARIEVIKESIN